MRRLIGSVTFLLTLSFLLYSFFASWYWNFLPSLRLDTLQARLAVLNGRFKPCLLFLDT